MTFKPKRHSPLDTLRARYGGRDINCGRCQSFVSPTGGDRGFCSRRRAVQFRFGICLDFWSVLVRLPK